MQQKTCRASQQCIHKKYKNSLKKVDNVLENLNAPLIIKVKNLSVGDDFGVLY